MHKTPGYFILYVTHCSMAISLETLAMRARGFSVVLCGFRWGTCVKGYYVGVCYNSLWKLLNDKNMNKTELKEAANISFNVMARMGKNETISFESIQKICLALHCDVGDIISIASPSSETDKQQQTSDSVSTSAPLASPAVSQTPSPALCIQPAAPCKLRKTIELFAGAGGLALGIEKAGFTTIGLIEFDKAAANTLTCNRPQWRVINDDIANISCLNLEQYFDIQKGELDLLSGGAPCQSFSYAGKRLGLEDARGTLFYHYATFLTKLQPKMFLFENVKGLLSHDKGKTYKTITQIFEQAGYTIQKRVLNAWDYGVAQKRERLITIGIRNDLTDKIKFSFPRAHQYKPVLRDILLDCPKSEGACYSEAKRKIFDLVPPGGYWRDVPEDVARAYMKSCWYMEGGRTGILRRLSLDEPSLTVLTTPTQKQTERCHPLESRPFTIRENARCQSFPDDWQFCGSISQQYKQVGNAVPVNLAYDIALQIKRALEAL